ncbi:unnamed protein product [Anisakis simplex]|uniref:C2 domain-containing protein n=1 Tax=Anisakis simplex TaxID=6269 RepID=A0A3P6QZM4_ANISI|nr:unnamed protein product [Anisakis simplex]
MGGAADAILYHSFNFSNLPYVYRRIMILGVFLEWTHDKISLNERAVSYAITQLRTSSHIDIDKCFLASCRLSLAADHFIRKTLHSAHAIRFFPPIAHNSLMEFGRKIELAMSMRNLELWRHFPSHSPFESFGDELRQIIHDEVVIWIEEQYELDLPKSVRSISYSLSLLAEPYISFFPDKSKEQKSLRTMCRNLTLRALDEDNDTTYDERVLPSCVNFLAVHKALYEDFSRLQLRNTSTALMCVLKIALTVADDLLLYAKQMKAENHRFDSNKRMLAANSIDHICKFVQNNTSRLLGIDALLMSLPEAESYQANSTLHQILSNTVEQCKSVSIWIVTSLCEERSETIAKHCHSITQVGTKRRKNLCDYEMIRRIVQADEINSSTSVLMNALYLNSSSTKELIQQYYTQLADRSDSTSLQTSMPHIRIRIGYVPTTNQRVIIQIDVLGASNLPILDHLAKTCDAYCRIEVLPHIIFPLEQFQAQTTMIQKETHNPTWDEHFQLMVNEDCFYMNGSVLCLSVLEHEVLGYNDLVGQGFVQLSRIPRLISFSKKHRAAITRLPLLLPTKEQFIGPFQVLVERSAKDVTAKAMCDYERYLHDYHMLPPYADRSNTTRILRRRSTFKKLMMHAHIRRSATTILTSSS